MMKYHRITRSQITNKRGESVKLVTEHTMAGSLFSIASSTGKISNLDSDDEGEGNSSTNNKYKI